MGNQSPGIAIAESIKKVWHLQKTSNIKVMAEEMIDAVQRRYNR